MAGEVKTVGGPTLEDPKRYFIETFGCQMNVLDSERASAVLRARGFEWTGDATEADFILFNTCSVREKAAERVFARIAQLKWHKKEGAIVGVMGCVAQAEGARLIERSPDVRLVMGTQALGDLGPMLDQLAAGSRRAVSTRTPNRPEFDALLPRDRLRRHIAYVTIMEGCDKFCTFCIVPFTRGRERSRSPESILAEVQALAEYGYKEVQLLGQNVNSYGMGRRIEGGQRLGFSALLKLVASKSMLPRIKFTTSHPRDFGPDIVQAIEEHQGLCPWVHLPPQSGSDRVLAAMNRGYTYSDYMRKAAMIRNARRDINLTADLIVGFPGETEKDFRRTLDLVREAEFDGAYMFKYSPRPGTVAARWSDGTPEPEKTERFLRLQEIQKEVQNRRDQRYLGRMVEVLVEGKSAKSESHWTGHTPCNKVVNFSSTASNVEGLIVKVEVTKINPQSLFGQQVG